MLMGFIMPLDDMSIEDKLTAMEKLWDNLCRTPESIPSPPWHEETLLARENRIRDGKATFSTLDDVKDRVKKTTK
jgi:putative addiction module component (TIGR02574 family)